MANIVSVTVSVRTSWWLRWYIKGVVVMCYLTGCVPNEKRLYWWVKRGTRVSCDAS